jgi:hypothetical protein
MDKQVRTNKSETLFVRVTPDVAERFEEVAASNGRRPSEELRAIIVEHLDKYIVRQATAERAS